MSLYPSKQTLGRVCSTPGWALPGLRAREPGLLVLPERPLLVALGDCTAGWGQDPEPRPLQSGPSHGLSSGLVGLTILWEDGRNPVFTDSWDLAENPFTVTQRLASNLLLSFVKYFRSFRTHGLQGCRRFSSQYIFACAVMRQEER